jgi:RNA polymerase sigma factor (sigma-70 family)
MQPESDSLSAEAALVVAAQGGDMAAFEALYREYFGAVYDFAARTMKDSHAAADAVQDAFLKAHDKIGQLRDPEAFRPWLYSIVRREALVSFRSQARETIVPAIDDDGGGLNPLLSMVDDDLAGDPTAAAELSDSAALVWEAASSLDADTYTVLDLHVRQGLSSAEIADVLGISKGNAYTKLNRMKERTGVAISTYLLIRKGSKDCDGLSQIVAGVELPPVTETLRKRVDRHAKSCDECSERRKALVSPMSIFAAMAAVPPPPGLEQAIWTNVSGSVKAGGTGLRRRGLWALTVIGVFIAVIGLVSVLGTGSTGDGVVAAIEDVALGAPIATPVTADEPVSTTGATTGVGTSGEADSDITVTTLGPDTDGGLVPVPSPASPVPTTTSTTPSTAEAPSGATDTTAVPLAEPPPASTPPPVDTTVTTSTLPPPPPPDTTPPSIAGQSGTPGEVWELDGLGVSCPGGTSRLSKIAAQVSDAESGVATVKASWTIGGSTSTMSMSLVAGSYTADFGPFQAGTVPDGTWPSITVSIVAMDAVGNASNTSVAVTVYSIADCFI